ncbi:M24 family metallopeptidase [Natronospora cellulosivora (SeqCode)]
MKLRLEKAQELLKKKDIEALLIDSNVNCFYLSTFTGTSARILLTHKENYFFTDFRYLEQAKNEIEGFEIIEINRNFEENLNKLINDLKINRIGFESKAVKYKQYQKYDKVLEAELIAVDSFIEELRIIKDKEEIEKIKKAVLITDQAFEHICQFIKPGLSEKEVSLELEFFMKKNGISEKAFDFIVASGKRSSLPHGVASDKIIEKGDFITMDFGGFYQGYCSDMTRTIVLGKADDKQKEIYNIVLKAQLKVIENIKANMSCKDADAIARDIINKAGYKENFGHGLGHGIGLEVHEDPRLSFASDHNLKAGMVVSNEPGIYIPDWGGVRIEDDLLITDEACEVLNRSTKELIEL